MKRLQPALCAHMRKECDRKRCGRAENGAGKLQDVQLTVRISNKQRLDGRNGGVVGGGV